MLRYDYKSAILTLLKDDIYRDNADDIKRKMGNFESQTPAKDSNALLLCILRVIE